MALMTVDGTHLMRSSYSLFLPLESFQRLYMTDASTLAGEYVLGSFRRDITLSRMVLWPDMNETKQKKAHVHAVNVVQSASFI